MRLFCHTLLAEADAFAVDNVISGRGGPFAAAKMLYDRESDRATAVGSISANAVLSTGVASAHAEDRALQPDRIRELIFALQAWNSVGTNPTVIFGTSSQSCPSCHAKEEIVARHLIQKGFIRFGEFVVAHGATFADTAALTRLNDLPYVLDLIRYAREPHAPLTMVRHSSVHVNDLPPDVASLFKAAASQVAIVARGNNVVATGGDVRGMCNPISTAEVMAIRNACAIQRAKGIEYPWTLGDPDRLNPAAAHSATLYTATPEVGPLMRGEAQWAAINNIVTVTGIQMAQTLESPGISNADLLRAVARGYNHSDSALTVVRDDRFANDAQRAWAKRLQKEGDRILYNGIDADSDLERFAPYAQKAFSAKPLRL